MVGTIIGTLILIAGFLLKNNETVKQTALGVLIFSSLMAIPTYLTSEGAEDFVENLPGISESAIEAHEDLGKLYLMFMLVLGTLSLFALLLSLYKNKYSSVLFIAVLFVAIGTSVFSKQVGSSGGEIRHIEIQGDSSDQDFDKTKRERSKKSDDD